MSYFNVYPYINLTDLNLDYIFSQIKEMANKVDNFVSINAIKYADPIQWDITSQYEKNTIVIDGQTGTAYISVQPVPSGVALNRTEYWSVVFDLSAFITRAAKNFTTNYEDETTLTATMSLSAGDWVVWGDVLYRALVNITAGDSYVIGSNIEKITVEDIKNELITTIDSLYDEISDRVGALADLSTNDKTNIVNAINEIFLNITNSSVDTVAGLIATDIGENEYIYVRGYYSAYDGGGAYYHIDSTPTAHFYHLLNNGLYANIIVHGTDNILQYGAIADDTTDITSALQYLIDSPSKSKYIPAGFYKLASSVTITTDNVKLYGDGYGTRITYSDTNYAININAQRVEICDIRIMAYTGGAFKYTGTRHGFLNVHNNTMYVSSEALLINCEGGYDAFNDNTCYKVTGASGWLVSVDTTNVSDPQLINYWTIKNNEFACQTNFDGSGIYLPAMNVCDIIDNDFTGLIFGVSITADVSRVDHINIDGNKFYTVTHGIFMRSSNLSTIINITNNLFRCKLNCIYDDNQVASAIIGVNIADNEIIYSSAYNPSFSFCVLHYIDDLTIGNATINNSSVVLSSKVGLTNCNLISKPNCGVRQSFNTSATGSGSVVLDVHKYPLTISYLTPVAYTNHSTGNAIDLLDTVYDHSNGTITVNYNITNANPRDHIISLI